MRLWAWIPARGGSKSIPRKNIQLLHGIPLIVYTIEWAKQVDVFERIIVSTDDPEIMQIAKEAGVFTESPQRPHYLALDNTRDEQVLDHLVEWVQERGEAPPDWWVQLRPTYPYRGLNLMRDMMNLVVQRPDVDAIRTVVRSKFHPAKMYVQHYNGFLEPLYREWNAVKEPYEAPRQELPIVYAHNGCIDMIRHGVFLEDRKCKPIRTYGFEMDESENYDIDTYRDWDYVSRVLNKDGNPSMY